MNLSFYPLRHSLQTLLSSFDSGALLTAEGEILHLKYETLADIGTLGAAASTVMKYFPLEMGDVVLLNDPYSGGTTLSTMTLVTPLCLKHPSIPNLFLAVRIGFKPHFVISNKLEEEGLRIPPTPLTQKFQLNQAVLEAISSHPLCPVGFRERMSEITTKLFHHVDVFSKWMEKRPELYNKNLLKNYIKESHDRILHILSELPHGEIKTETNLENGEVIKLKLELQSDTLRLDFSGTSTSNRVCLTDSSTFGACMGALAAFLEHDIPMNTGLFSILDLATPLGCLLNAKYPSPTFKGMTEGTSLVALTVLNALMSLSPKNKMSLSAVAPTMIGFEFGTGLRFFDSLPGGLGASVNSDGVDALQFWVRNRLQPSVEEIERRFPLIIRKMSLRAGSGGKGQHRGGNGIACEYELLDSAKFSWSLGQRKHTPAGSHGAQNGHPGEITLISADGNKVIIAPSEGTLILQKGDRLVVHSAGGGGYGKA